jgi:predicted peptidase
VWTCLPDPGCTSFAAPTILFLHGIGERGVGNLELDKLTRWGLPKHRTCGWPTSRMPAFPFLVVAPQCPPGAEWSDPAIVTLVEALIHQFVEGGYSDPRRLTVAGFSMGAIGAFSLALSHPDRFSALVSVCGRCSHPDELYRLEDLPTWVAYAEDDEIEVLTEGSRLAAAALTPHGNCVVRPYRVGASGGQSAHARTADAAFAEPDLYAWLASPHRRPPGG